MSQSEPILMMYERERIILEHIKDNPELHHNALLKLVVPKFMAKTTFEKLVIHLSKRDHYANSKSNMKFYHIIENYTHKAAQHIEQDYEQFFS